MTGADPGRRGRRPRTWTTRWIVVAVAAGALVAASARAEPPRFFFAGNGTLDLYSAYFNEHLQVRYRAADGSYDPHALTRIERFFRSRNDGKSIPVSLRLVELIAFVQTRYRPSRLTLVSGYRSREFNQTLRRGGRRVAQASLHTEGLAADLQPAGVDLRRMWLELRELRVGGTGLYAKEGFIHLDAGRPRFWEPATSGVETNRAAGNAQLFARTDFDRYADLRGAVIRLHSVTALPVRIERTARLGAHTLTLDPVGEAIVAEGRCLVVREPAERYAFAVATSLPPPAQPTAIRVRTCAPRVGATPKEILTNPIAALAEHAA